MEPLRDLTWMRYLVTGPPVEKAERPGYTAVFVVVPRTKERHLERYRYRAFVFEPATRSPILAVNLESDILGEYILTLEDARGQSVLERYDRELSYEEFRTRTLAEAERRMPPGVPSAQIHGKRTPSPYRASVGKAKSKYPRKPHA